MTQDAKNKNVLPSWFAETEALKSRILERLDAMPAEKRHVSPGPRHWSAAQVVAHLVLVEETLVKEWRPAALANSSIKPSKKSAMMARMAGFGMAKTPIRMPTVPGLEPAGGSEAVDLSAHWNTVREQLRAALPRDTSALWIIHPIFGPISGQAFGPFLVAHLRHHWNHWPE